MLVFFAVIVLVACGLVYIAKRLDVSKGSIPLLVNKVALKEEDIPDLSGMMFIITGANSGLGYSSTKILARAGATCIMACRSLKRAKAAKEQIVKEIEESDKKCEKFKEENIIEMILDLNSLNSVKEFAEAYQAQFNSLDCLMLNAGIMLAPFTLTKDGIESQFGINHVGHFYLTKLLMPTLVNSQPCSIVSVSSAASFSSYKEGIRDFEKINDKELYNASSHYGQSKLANILFSQELNEQLIDDGHDIYINAIHPGVVFTELMRHLPKWLQDANNWLNTKYPNSVLFDSDTAAMNQVYAALAPVVLEKKVSGKYYVPIGEECGTPKHAKDRKLQKKLWTMTEDFLKEKNFLQN